MLRPQQAGARLARLRLLQQQHHQQSLKSASAHMGAPRAPYATGGRDGEPPASGGILSNMLKRCG